jgi:hypothetical protein
VRDLWLTTGPFQGTATTAFVNVDNFQGADLVMVNWQQPMHDPSTGGFFWTGPCVWLGVPIRSM